MTFVDGLLRSINQLPLAIRALIAIVVLIAAIYDIRTRRIPNWLTFSGLFLAIALNVFLNELPGLWFSLEGMGVAFGLYFFFYILRAMGAGDVKLMAFLGAAVGWANWVFGILPLTGIFGGIIGILLVVAKGRLRKTMHNIQWIFLSLRLGRAPYQDNPELDVRSGQGMRMPHAVMIACAVIGLLSAATIYGARLNGR
jgi:prepilin peptidase CpaA